MKDKLRPLAFDERNFFWNMQLVPLTLQGEKTKHPSRTSAIFVVHGIGQQQWCETAAHLRAGFEDAFEDIASWRQKHLEKGSLDLPPPFIYDGYWANYDDIQETFPENWKRFNEREQKFFRCLWKNRVVSGARTIVWMLHQQMRLLHPKVLKEVGLLSWILYWPLQIVSSTTLLFAWFRKPALITGYINDMRLYLNPRGVVERAIVKRIDYHVGCEFLRLIGLSEDFRPLPENQLVAAGGDHFAFSRVVWVAHSLGTVISYNVLSALFHKAKNLKNIGDAQQKDGVDHFRNALVRFVTMGSPLGKVAFLFKSQSLRPWPVEQRRALLDKEETLSTNESGAMEWWVNFYHVLDPVSGVLDNPFICGKKPPSNFHIRSGFIPGCAHVAYWTDRSTLRFILGRTYGTKYLKDREYSPLPHWILRTLAVMAYFTWAILLLGAVYGLYRYAPYIVRLVGKAALKWITG
jgi:hypothetical protein